MIFERDFEEMLEGKCGPYVQKAAEIVKAIAESYGADRFVRSHSGHMPGASYYIIGDAGARFVDECRRSGAKFAVPVTTNPGATDRERKDWDIPAEMRAGQAKLTGNYAAMGAHTCQSCIPYMIGYEPRFGEHIAWGESSAVVYANSVLGARTNREGGPSVLASALTGYTALAGLHLDENRVGTYMVNVKCKLETPDDYSLLGYFVGQHCTEGVPVFDPVPDCCTTDDLKQLGGSLAASGAVALYHVVGRTPEAPTLKDAFKGHKPKEKLDVTDADLAHVREHLTKAAPGKVSWIMVGCPHNSLRELVDLGKALRGRKLAKGLEFWCCVPSAVRDEARRYGYLGELENTGVKVIGDSCPGLTTSRVWAEKHGWANMMSNSAKMCHYTPGEFGVPTIFGTLDECAETAVSGVWRG